MSTVVDHRVRALRAADWCVVRTATATVVCVVACVMLWRSRNLAAIAPLCFLGVVVCAALLAGAARRRRRLPRLLTARTAFEDAHRRGWHDAQLLDHALRRGAVLTERPAGMLVLDSDERVHVRVVVPVSLAHGPAGEVEVTLTTHALVTVFPDGHLARWWWSAAIGLRIDLARWRIDLYWTGTGDSLHIYGPQVPLVAVYAAHQLWSPEQFRTNPQLRPLRAGLVAAEQFRWWQRGRSRRSARVPGSLAPRRVRG